MGQDIQENKRIEPVEAKAEVKAEAKAEVKAEAKAKKYKPTFLERRFCRKSKKDKIGLPTLIMVMIPVIGLLFMPIMIDWMSVNAQAADERMAELDHKEIAQLVDINKSAQVKTTIMAHTIIKEKKEEEQKKEAKKLKKWLKAQEKRVAKAKAKKARQEALKKIEREAEENTRRTYGESGWSGQPLTKGRGTITGPSGKETYYNLNMSGVVGIMRSMGFSEEEYPYEVREDGVKTLGGYVMVAANLKLRPRGSFIMTSCGTGIVCDTGGFAAGNPTQLDLATNW